MRRIYGTAETNITTWTLTSRQTFWSEYFHCYISAVQGSEISTPAPTPDNPADSPESPDDSPVESPENSPEDSPEDSSDTDNESPDEQSSATDDAVAIPTFNTCGKYFSLPKQRWYKIFTFS